MTEHRCLSIRQPWCDLILAGWKTTENRGWTTKYRGLLVLHAGKVLHDRGWDAAVEFGVRIPRTHRGAFLGTARLVDVHCGADGDCCGRWGERDAFHWVLADPVRFAEPVPASGRLGLWRPPEGVLTQERCRHRVTEERR